MAFNSETAKKAGHVSTRKGTPNEANKEIRESLKRLLESNLETLKDDLETLDPKDRIKILLELAKFVIPSLKATEMTTKEDFKKIEVTIIPIKNENLNN